MKQIIILDCEVYPNYFLIAFKNIKTQKTATYEAIGSNSKLTDIQCKAIKSIMAIRETVGFNSLNYDIPIILYALQGKTCNDIYNLSKEIIESHGIPTFVLMNKYNLFKPIGYTHFDLIALNPGKFNSLKMYGARIHSKKLQELPYDPNIELDNNQIENLKIYCLNDLNTTIDLYNRLLPEINLRRDLTKLYKLDLMSKSNAQIAEAIIKSELEKLKNEKIVKPTNVVNVLTYKAPDFISFKSQDLQNILQFLQENYFIINNQTIKLIDKNFALEHKLKENTCNRITDEEFKNYKDEIKSLKVTIGDSTYKIGFGGLHSQEESRHYIANENQYIIDKDVASYYPSIIINLGLYPKQLGVDFLLIFKKLVRERLKAKKDHNKTLNECLKIVINGTYGKLGDKYSIMYSPNLMLTVTITGQLALLMLIERLERENIKVVSANTDGIVSVVDKDLHCIYEDIVTRWEDETGFKMEDTFYKALYSRDVNNYLAIKNDNSYKGKGIFTESDLDKNPMAEITYEACIQYLVYNIPIEKTIYECNDITKFIVIRRVTGGATYNNEYLGKVVRWIYTTDGLSINYLKNNNKVAMSDGAYPVMELIDIPKNIDYEKYIDLTYTILYSLGLEKFKPKKIIEKEAKKVKKTKIK